MPRHAKKPRATAQDQDLLFKVLDVNVIDSVSIGDTQLRLVLSVTGKTKTIELWSSLSQAWRTMHRYNVEEQWEMWKKRASVYNEKQKDSGRATTHSKPKRTRSVAARKPGVGSGTIGTKDRKRDRKRTVKD